MEQISSMAVKWEKQLRHAQAKAEQTTNFEEELRHNGIKRSISSIYIP